MINYEKEAQHAFMHFCFEIKVTLCFEIQKNSINNIINISEDSLQVTSSKQAKPGAYEAVAVLSLQIHHFLALVYILYFYLTNPLYGKDACSSILQPKPHDAE